MVQEDNGKFLTGRPQPAEVMEVEFKRPTAGVARLLADLTPGEPRSFGAVTLVPLIAHAPVAPPFALESSAPPASVGSHDEAWLYQSLQNPAAAAKIAVLGQVLEGPKTQDRAVERTQLLPASGKGTVMAYCCEHLFTARAGEPLAMTEHFLPGEVRARFAQDFAQVVMSLGPGVVQRRFDGVQDFTWAAIAARIREKHIASRYEAFLDLVPHRDPDLLAAARAPLPPMTAGLAIGVGGRLFAVECFATPELLAAHAPELVASWLDQLPGGGAPDPAAIRAQAIALLAVPPRTAALVASEMGAVTLALSAPASGLALAIRGRPVHALLVP